MWRRVEVGWKLPSTWKSAEVAWKLKHVEESGSWMEVAKHEGERATFVEVARKFLNEWKRAEVAMHVEESGICVITNTAPKLAWKDCVKPRNTSVRAVGALRRFKPSIFRMQ
jgi:hypothetical protein